MSRPAAEQAASLKQQGNAAFAAGDFAAAAQHYSSALRLLDSVQTPAGLHLLHGNRAAAHLKLGNWAAALADAESALAIDPKWVKALYRKAAALQRLGRLAAAEAAAKQALTLEPGNREVQALLKQLESTQSAAQAAAAAANPAANGATAPSAPSTTAASTVAGPRKPAFSARLLPPLLATAPWEYIPAADGVDENLLLLLHGLGDKPAAFARLARQMALPQTAALALGGPQEVPFSDGGRSWYTVFTEDFELIEGLPREQRRIRSLQQTIAALRQLLLSLQNACGWPSHRVHLLGFSQGGSVALELARYCQAAGQPLGSCTAVSAGLLPEQLAQGLGEVATSGSNGGAADKSRGENGEGSTAVLITHGSADKVVSRAVVDQTAAALRSVHGMQVSVHSVPGKGHAMPQGPDEMRALMQFWARHLSRRPIDAELPAGAVGPGELLEVRPGEVSIQLVGEQQQAD